jgi:hypothetical protein
MAGRGVVLESRILSEIAALELIVTKVERAWKAAGANNDDLYYDSVALNIHSFYSGLEKIFEKNVYTYYLSPDKMRPLAKSIRPVFKQVEKELRAFGRFIQSK